jgi:hypothetical protein
MSDNDNTAHVEFPMSGAQPNRVFSTEITVSKNCHANGNSHTYTNRYRGYAYENNTDFEPVLTGREKFTVKEIEVFEIAD